MILDLKGHAVLYYDANGDATVTVEDLTAIIDALLTDGEVGYTDRSVTLSDMSGAIDYMLTGNPEMDVDDGLVAYYPFNGDAKDASGHGNDGVLSNVTPTTGTYGEADGAYQFGGYYNQGYIRIPNSESLKFTDGFSFSCFVKPTDWFGQDTDGAFTTTDAVQAIFAKSNDHNGPAFQFAGTPSRIKFYSSSLEQNSQWCGLNSLDRIQGDKQNNWIHVAFTYSDKVACMYIDGELIQRKSITPNFSQMNSQDLYLGRYSNDWYPLNGALDEVRIYNRALTEVEVLALAEGSEQAYAETHPFKLSQRSVSLAVGESVTIEILNGNGSYSVGGDSDIVDFTLNQENESITLTGIAEGTTTVTVIDVNTQTTISLPVTVTQPQGQIVMERKYWLKTVNDYYINSFYNPMRFSYQEFRFSFDNGTNVTIQYHNGYYWNDTYSNSHLGVFVNVSRDGQNEEWYISPLIKEEWVDEKIMISNDGTIHYWMNGEDKGTHLFDLLTLDNANNVSITMSPYGWYFTHYHYMDDFKLFTPSVCISDNFNDGVLDNNIWQTPVNPDGVREENGILKAEQLRTDKDFNLRSYPIPSLVTANEDNHEWVDLGLPSGTLWATCNVGADTPEDMGDHFAWGETAPKEVYEMDNYKWYDSSSDKLTKYCTDAKYGTVDYKTELLPEDDAAYVNWGPSWRMPTQAQQQELIDNCTWTWTTRNGVNGRLVTGPNGNTMFLPVAGFRWHSSQHVYTAGETGYYWSHTLIDDSNRPYLAHNLYFGSNNVYYTCDVRERGFTVRAVRIPQN